MKRIELSTGTIEYRELGTGPVVVFVHGFLVDGELWSGVVERLAESHRCIVPTWPLGSHPIAQHDGADTSVTGVAALVGELMDALELTDVTLVGNDSGGVVSQLAAADHGERVGRLVLTNCDALDVFPPRGFGYLRWLGRIPGLAWVMAKSMRAVPALMRWKYAFGALTAEPIAREQLVKWVTPLASDAGVRRDVVRLIASVDPQLTIDVATRLAARDIPVRLVWGADDPFFTLALAERLAAVVPRAQVHPIEGARTFVMLDAPAAVADAIADLVAKAEGSEPALRAM